MLRHLQPAIATILGLSLLGLTGCGGGSTHSPAERYFLIATNIKVPYWQEAGAGLVEAARQINVRAELVGPDTYDPKAQKQELQRVVALKPAGILISPADPGLFTADINAAIVSGIPVITMDSDSPASKRLVFIGTNNYQAGLMGGRTAAQKLGGKGNVVVFTIPTQLNLEERLNGYKAAFEGTGIKIVDTVDVHGDPRLAFDQTSSILEKKSPAIDGFICLEALACKEVAEVLTRNKVSGKVVVGMDTQSDTLDWVEKGVINATVAQKPYTMAYFGLKLLADLNQNKLSTLNASFAQDSFSPLPTFIDTGATLIDKYSVSSFRQASNAARAKKQ
jgi:ribose transport system substrate-binding protein